MRQKSCFPCYTRKVKCDRREPCQNCVRLHFDCYYPTQNGANAASSNPQLLRRLHNLEGLVSSLSGVQIPQTTRVVSSNPKLEPVHSGSDGQSLEMLPWESAGKDTVSARDATHPGQFQGRLEVDSGRSRYLSDAFLAQMAEEVQEMKDLLDGPNEDDYGTSSSQDASEGLPLPLGSSLSPLLLRGLYPPSMLLTTYREIYLERIHSMMPILHLSTIERLFYEASRNSDHLSRSDEAALFIICFAATNSLNVEDCKLKLGDSKGALLAKYRLASEQTLARADFWNTQELLLLQSFVLFLFSVQKQDRSCYVYYMTGIAIKIARTLGIHKDGSHFDLNPYEIEMRRRLWWYIYTLDVHSSEDQAVEPVITQDAFDTRLPMNINDDDIFPGMSEPPTPRQGLTQMSFDLFRYDMRMKFITILTRPSDWVLASVSTWRTYCQEEERKIDGFRDYLNSTYLKSSDGTNPMQWQMEHVSRLLLERLRFKLYQWSLWSTNPDIAIASREAMIKASVELIECSLRLDTHSINVPWAWFFQTYTPFVVIVFLLSNLAKGTITADVDRGREVVQRLSEHWELNEDMAKKGKLWKPIRVLMKQVTASNRSLSDPQLLDWMDDSNSSSNVLDPMLSMSALQTDQEFLI